MTTRELLEAWRNANKAAELAEGLAGYALQRAEGAERNASVAEEIALLAEDVAATAERAAQSAREAANEARGIASSLRDDDLFAADETAATKKSEEATAHLRYRDAKREAHDRARAVDGGATGAID